MSVCGGTARVRPPAVQEDAIPATAIYPETDAGSAVPALPGTRVLVTGGSGFIGSHLAERLLAHGSTVRLLVRRPERVAAIAAAGANVHVGDLTDPASLRGSCEGIDVVYHAGAWLGTPYTRDAAWAANAAGTEGIVAEARRAGVRRFVHLSSIAVYGPVRSGTVTEAAPLWKGVELYGDSKIAAEEAARAGTQQGPELVITRPGMVYGPRSRGWTIRLIKWIDEQRPAIVAGGHGYARPIFIENLLDALVLCAQRPVSGEAFTLIDANVRWRDYLDQYARMAGKRVRSVSYFTSWQIALTDEIRAHLTHRPPRIRRTALGYAVSHALFSTEKAQRLLGWTPRYSMPEAMAITKDWLIANGYLKP